MKTKIKKSKSNKLFYNKWPYKICCRQAGASRIVRTNPSEVRYFCNGINSERFSHWQNGGYIDKSKLLAFVDKVEPFLENKNLQIRTENSHFNIYCKDLNLFNELIETLKPWVTEIFEPESEKELKFLLENGSKKVICSKLPKENFLYRVYFKTNTLLERRKNFLSWAEKYKDSISVSRVTERWCYGKEKYTQAPFMYVKDAKTLSMIGLFLTGSIKKVEEFVLKEHLDLV